LFQISNQTSTHIKTHRFNTPPKNAQPEEEEEEEEEVEEEV
jgi:hypothetical protein